MVVMAPSGRVRANSTPVADAGIEPPLGTAEDGAARAVELRPDAADIKAIEQATPGPVALRRQRVGAVPEFERASSGSRRL